MTELDELLRQERLATVELLESLGPEEWEVPSLCQGWSVRDVAGHLASSSRVTPAHTVVGLLRSRFRVNRFIRDGAREWARRHPTDQIIARLREEAASGARPPFVPRLAPLTDAVLHGLDMRVPLGRLRAVPEEPFRLVAGALTSPRWPATVLVGGEAARRARTMRLVCEDVAWSHGEGAEVRGRSAAILLLLGGRPVEPGALTGPGVERLRAER